MSSLKELMGESSAPLSSLIVEDRRGSSLPEATVRNRAALVAIQTDNPESIVPNFQTIISEGEVGAEDTYKELSDKISEENQETDFPYLMESLADPNISDEDKVLMIKSFQDSERLTDQSFSLADKALIAPSEGENEEQETVRLSVSEILAEYMRQKEIRQGLVNQFIMDNEQKWYETAVDYSAILVPGTEAYTNMAASQAIFEALGLEYGVGSKLRDIVAPGVSALKIREHFHKLSPDEQIDAVSKILKAIQSNNAIIAGDENQVRAMILLERFLEGEYDTIDAVVDSLFNVLDIVGIGVLLRSGVKAVQRGRSVRAASDTPSTPAAPTESPSAPSSFEGAPMPEARVRARAQEIEDLEAEYAALLARQQSELDPGSVRNLREESKQIDQSIREAKSLNTKDRARQIQERDGISARAARAEAKKEIDDLVADLEARRKAIDERLRINAETSKAAQKLPEVERKLAAARKDPSTVPARLNPIQDSLRRIGMNSVVAVDNAASAGRILMDMNPQKGRMLFKAIYESDSDDVARAALGVGRVEAIAQEVLPQMATESGIVRKRVPDIQRELDVPLDEGGLRFTDVERSTIRSKIEEDFKNANGLTVHDAEGSISVELDGGYVRVSAMYGTTEGGFLRAEDAVEQAKLALRNQGILDEEITVMRRNGLDYEPVNLEDVRGIDGDYKIRVDTRIDQNLEVMGDGWEAFDVKRNFFDRFSSTISKNAGSLTRHLFDSASNLHPNLSGSFSVATDVAVNLEKHLLKYADKFAKGYNKLPANRKNKVWDYLLEANDRQYPHDLARLRARGFTDNEIDLLGEFRNFWDMHYQLENLDLARTLRSRGFQVLESTVGDTFFARPVPKNRNLNKVYDPSSGDIRYLSVDEMDDLYDNGGTVALLKSPIDVNGDQAAYLMSRNTGTEYLRRVRDNDRILNYREGYFQINYKAPQYIRELDADGTPIRAVAVRGSKKDAQLEAERLASVTGKRYKVTGDDRDKGRAFDDTWDLNQTSGRIAHRRRGERLEGSEGRNIIDGKEFVENPIDSSIRAARSIAGRTVMRPALETAKARFLKQYGHLVRKDQYGRPEFPSDLNQIGTVGEYTTKELADARTTFEFIHMMENGYINQIDETSKALFNTIANAMGELNVKTGGGFGVAEAAARKASQISPSGVVRGVAFQAYIALSPFRNWILQPQQVIRTVAYNPMAWASGDMVKYFIGASRYFSGLPVQGDTLQMLQALEKTGMLDSVDRSNLVRGALLQASESSSKVARGLSKAPEMSRKIGFDIGEKINLFGHYAAVWSKYKRAGENMSDPNTLSRIHNEARAISGEFNKTGDFAYNQNILSVPLQFAQVPHKFVLTLTNRKMDRATRARMIAGDIILWGVPGTHAVSQFLGDDILPEDPNLRDIITSGVAAFSINEMLRRALDDDTDIDFSTLAPYNIGGFVELVSASMDEGIGTMLNNTPAGQLLFNDSGRVGAAFKSLFRHFSPIEEGLETPETLLDTVNQFAKISSGWNNITKAWFAANTGMAVDRFNMPIDTSVTIAEAVAMGFGFQTKDSKRHYDTIGKLIDNRKHNETVAKDIAESILQMYSSAYSGEIGTDPEYISRLSGAILAFTEKNPMLAAAVYNQIKMRIRDPNDRTMENLLKAVGMPSIQGVEAAIRDSALSPEEKKQLLDILATRQQLIQEEP